MQDPIVPKSSNAFDILYMVTFAGLIAYFVYLGINFDNYSEDELVAQAYILFPILSFSSMGLLTLKNERSIIYALCSAVVSFMLLLFFFEAIWPKL